MTTLQLSNYFETQKAYYNFLHSTLKERFKGSANQANGMVKDGSYHGGGWNHLSNIENKGFRHTAFLCMDGQSVRLEIRNGESMMEATVSDFPKMKIVKYLNESKYGRLSIGGIYDLWQCNEILKVEGIRTPLGV